jgi:hypothetical protein
MKQLKERKARQIAKWLKNLSVANIQSTTDLGGLFCLNKPIFLPRGL